MPVTEFKVARVGDVALVTIDNGEDWTKPTFFGEAALASYERALAELEAGDFRAAVITGKPFFFAAGADITEFPNITRERAVEGARTGHELFGRLRALPFPTVAAINGACLGGGVELALHCTARTISSAVRHFAFPEVFLGLFPAWGGTQLLPRLVGPEAAVKVIVSNPLRQNRMLKAADVAGARHRRPAASSRSSSSTSRSRSRLELADQPLERDEPDWSEAETIFRRARTAVDDAVHGAAPAPYVALDLIEGAQHWAVEEGYAREEEAIGELLPGPQAQASIYAFQLVEQRAKKHPHKPTAAPRKVHEDRHRRRRTDGAPDRRAVPQAPRGSDRPPRREAGDRRRGDRGRRRQAGSDWTSRRRGSSRRSSRAGRRTTASRTATSSSKPSSRSSRSRSRCSPSWKASSATTASSRRTPRRCPITEMAAELRHPGARRGHALLQSRRVDAAARSRACGGDVGGGARNRVGRRRAAAQAPDPRRGRAGLRRQPRADPNDARNHGRGRARHSGRRGRRGGDVARACRWRRRSCCRWSARASRITCSSGCTTPIPDRFPLSPALAAHRGRRRARRARGRAAHPRADRRGRARSGRRRGSPSARGRRRRQRPPTSTRGSCSAPAGRSSSAASRSISTRSAFRSASSVTLSPR